MNIDEIIQSAKDRQGLNAESALTLFNLDKPLDFAGSIRDSVFSKPTTISAELKYSPDQSLDNLQLHASKLAANGHRRILLKLNELGEHSPTEMVETLLSINRKRDNIRRVDLQLSCNISEEQLSELKELNTTVIFPAESDAVFVASSIGIADIGYSTSFTSDRFLEQLEILLHRADEIAPRIILIEYTDDIPSDIFEKICQIIRISHPFSSLIVSSENLELSKYANSFKLEEDEKLDNIINKMIKKSMLPSFCTACSLEERSGETFCSDCSSGKMRNCCYLNALVTLKEYLADFGAQDTRIVGTDMILRELYGIKNDTVRSLMVKVMKEIRNGERGMRF